MSVSKFDLCLISAIIPSVMQFHVAFYSCIDRSLWLIVSLLIYSEFVPTFKFTNFNILSSQCLISLVTLTETLLIFLDNFNLDGVDMLIAS